MQRPDPATIPDSPGVYLYRNAEGHILYVGKARILKRRVLSYFRQDVSSKTAAMLSHATDISYISTTTEKEALLLEASLIKKYRPHYNISLRDDKQYFLFRIDLQEQYPRIEIVRSVRRDGARYFGPFTSSLAARDTWKLLNRTFGIRRCSDRAMRNRVRPCLYHHMHQCGAPCLNCISEADYKLAVDRVCALLEGHADTLLASLTSDMERASEELRYEDAALLRDQIRAIHRTVEQQAVIFPGKADTDAIALCEGEKGMALSLLFLRGGTVTDSRSFYWEKLRYEDSSELLLAFLSQYYAIALPPPRILLPFIPDTQEENGTAQTDETKDGKGDGCTEPPSGTDRPERRERHAISLTVPEDLQKDLQDAATGSESPGRLPDPVRQDIPGSGSPASHQTAASQTDERPEETGTGTEAPPLPSGTGTPDLSDLHTDGEDRDLSDLLSVLSDRRGGYVRITAPQNTLDNQLIDIACANAREEARRREHPAEESILQKTAHALHLTRLPKRIECVDVSHTQGKDVRVGMVVYTDGKPSRDDYRVYAMDDSADDYATLAAWIPRRLESGPPWPDLLLIDGGIGQLSVVQQALERAGQKDLFPLASIAKARDEDGHADRRKGNVGDRIFLPNRTNALPIRAGSSEILFLQQIRDATHSFAISRHRRAHENSMIDSALLSLPNIGARTARLLWENFGSLEAIRRASAEDLLRLPGIGKKKAEQILNSLKDL